MLATKCTIWTLAWFEGRLLEWWLCNMKIWCEEACKVQGGHISLKVLEKKYPFIQYLESLWKQNRDLMLEVFESPWISVLHDRHYPDVKISAGTGKLSIIAIIECDIYVNMSSSVDWQCRIQNIKDSAEPLPAMWLLLLWPPYGIGQAIIFSFCGFFLSSFFPRLISPVAEWMSTVLLHMVWP